MTKDERYKYNKTWRNDHRERVNELSRSQFKRNSESFRRARLIVAKLKVRFPDIYKELSLA